MALFHGSAYRHESFRIAGIATVKVTEGELFEEA
jgi:hypothetical protein